MELLVDSYTYDLFVKWCKEHKIPVSVAGTEALRKFWSDYVELVPKIDAVKTCDNVSNFFKDDLEKIVLMSGSQMADLSSPSFEENYSSSEANSIETKLINGLDAQSVVKSVHDALYHGVDPVSQRILIGLYIKRQRWIDIQPLVYREHTSFAAYRKRALLTFAYSFEGWQIKNHCDKVIRLLAHA